MAIGYTLRSDETVELAFRRDPRSLNSLRMDPVSGGSMLDRLAIRLAGSALAAGGTAALAWWAFSLIALL